MIKKLTNSPIIGPLSAMLLVFFIVAITTDRFLTVGNLSNIALQVSVVAIVAIGSAVVIFTGGIDLSPGAMIALLSMSLAMLIKFAGVPLAPAIVLVLILGGLLGALNGFLTAYVRIPAFITTLAGLSAYRGIAFMFNNGSPVFSLHPFLDTLFYGDFLGVPLPIYYVVVLYTIAVWGMKYTQTGRKIYAVGGNASAAKLSGINVNRIQMIAFIIAGLAAAFGAILLAARLNSGSPNYGVGIELQAIAAAVIGGASLAGGRGNVLNALIGALTIVIVQNGLNLNAVPTSMQNVTIGVIILVAVGIDMWRNEIGNSLQRLFAIKSPLKNR